MKKLRMLESNFLTLEEGCNKYLDNCRSRNLREWNCQDMSMAKIIAFAVKCNKHLHNFAYKH